MNSDLMSAGSAAESAEVRRKQKRIGFIDEGWN
jgi:hypothetical protein